MGPKHGEPLRLALNDAVKLQINLMIIDYIDPKRTTFADTRIRVNYWKIYNGTGDFYLFATR